MKLWLISQTENDNWDTYDSAVVAAETEEEAKMIDPSGAADIDWKYKYSSWASSPDNVACVNIGEAIEGTLKGVVCASFNAG